jgi:hypothetical protein
MKITKTRLKEIIEEEVINVLEEKLDSKQRDQLNQLKAKDDKSAKDKEKIKDLEHQ